RNLLRNSPPPAGRDDVHRGGLSDDLVARGRRERQGELLGPPQARGSVKAADPGIPAVVGGIPEPGALVAHRLGGSAVTEWWRRWSSGADAPRARGGSERDCRRARGERYSRTA